MNVRPSILCPIDYSDASAVALRYAAAIAEQFATRLIVLTVEDPLLTTAMDFGTGVHRTREASQAEMATFANATFGDDTAIVGMCEYDVAVGTPPVEILRVARERSCDVIVMSSHGLTGARTLFLGSTTERVLRETTVPVLVTPPANPGPIQIEDVKRLLGRIVAPVGPRWADRWCLLTCASGEEGGRQPYAEARGTVTSAMVPPSGRSSSVTVPS